MLKSTSTFVLLFIFTVFTQAQTSKKNAVSGFVKDNFGIPIPGATIRLKDQSTGTSSDVDGYYKLQTALPGNAIIQVTAVGYSSEERAINDKFIQDFQLKEDRNYIDEVVVSARGKTENEHKVAEIKRSGFNVSVIDMNKHANEAANLTQILKRATGVTIREDGGLGSNFVFRINGLNAKIYIDGVPMENFGSSMSLNNIPVNLIDRVEVYKGVVPAFLGSDALGGAVNIITKRRARPYLDLSYSYGSFNTHQAAIVGTFTNPKNKLSFRMNAFYNHSDNDYNMYTNEKYNVLIEKTVENKYVMLPKAKRFNDAYTSAMGQLEVGFRDVHWADQFYAGLTYSQNHKENQLGASISKVFGGMWSESNYLMPTLSYKKSNFLVDRLYADIFTSYSYDTRYVRDTAMYNYDWSGNWISNYKGTAPNAQMDTKYNLSNYLARVNLNYDFDEARNQSLNFNYNFNNNDQKQYDLIGNYDRSGLPSYLGRHILGLSWQNQWFDKRLSNVLAVKYYRMNASKDIDERIFDANNNLISGGIISQKKQGNYYSMSLASRYRITKDGGWKLSYERAYNLPSMTALYGDGINTISNWDLKPERSDNINTGFYYNTYINQDHFLNVDVTGFYRLADNYINSRAVMQNGNAFFQSYNEEGVKLYGFEAEVKYGFKDLLSVTLNGSYDKATYNKKYTDDSRQQISINYGKQLINRPWVYGNADISLIQNNWFQKGSRIQLSYLYQYTHWFYLTESDQGSLESKDLIPSQNVHSAVLSYAWDRNKYNVSFEARNLTDERAYDNFRLQRPGRAFYVKLRLSIM
ncbi:MAG: TonB-dependent receptor [Sphingobacterium sp.]|jgi:outer membrane receptor protein involved in Fe transport|uniref:TonB-dependent receptor n=1 Tax=Sphingobacterium sp. TaxID=341027 RepID=UPI002851AD50|nr:TonB-dependent receptor [Sphingobacterium sp.]MDR3008084.1 TonB-dependent receptor [Sphingobacterium sp.]